MLPGSSAAAQDAARVLGRVTDAAGTGAIVGAVVLLVGPTGTVASTLSGADGQFVVVVPRAGRYAIHGQMIGREPMVTDTFEVVTGRDVVRNIELRPRPVQLAAIDVSGDRQCRNAEEVGRATELVWEEARTALRAQLVTRDLALYEFDLVSFEHAVDRGDRRITSSWDTISTFRNDPFSSLPPEVLASDGYASSEDGIIYLYAPNTDALLSDAFLGTHCFRLERSSDEPGRIGLAFEPLEDRDETDIEGVLWLDEATSELRRLEFRYRNLPSRLMAGSYTGDAEFRLLPSGGWIIERWVLRSPMMESGRAYTRERGGLILRVRVPGREALSRRPASPLTAASSAVRRGCGHPMAPAGSSAASPSR